MYPVHILGLSDSLNFCVSEKKLKLDAISKILGKTFETVLKLVFILIG